jgi:hypothetical protein
VGDLVTDLLAKDPARRPTSAGAVVERLDALLATEATRARVGLPTASALVPRWFVGAGLAMLLAIALLVSIFIDRSLRPPDAWVAPAASPAPTAREGPAPRPPPEEAKAAVVASVRAPATSRASEPKERGAGPDRGAETALLRLDARLARELRDLGSTSLADLDGVPELRDDLAAWRTARAQRDAARAEEMLTRLVAHATTPATEQALLGNHLRAIAAILARGAVSADDSGPYETRYFKLRAAATDGDVARVKVLLGEAAALERELAAIAHP